MRFKRSFRQGGEALEDRLLLAADVVEHDHIGYFASPTAGYLERYDLDAEQWLSPLALENAMSVVTSFTVDDDGIYACVANSVFRYAPDGSGSTFLANNSPSAIHTDGNLLFLNVSHGLYADFISFNKTTNQFIDEISNYGDSVHGSSIVPELNRIIGRSQGVSPSDITFVGYLDDGTFNSSGDSPYHGAYPGATRTWVTPNGGKAIDTAGQVYATEDLSHLGSFGATITDIGFLQSVTIVLSGKTLTCYDARNVPTGSLTLDHSPAQILVNDRDVITFTPNALSPTGYDPTPIALSLLSAPDPGQPLDPTGMAYTPDKIEVANDGTLLILDRELQSIFRWDPDTRQYVETIALKNSPNYSAYSSVNNTIYLAYNSGFIRQISLDDVSRTETPFATLPTYPLGLSTAGAFVFAVDSSGSRNTHYTYSPSGELVEAVDWNYYSKEYVWSDANQKMYFFRDDTSPNDLLWEEINADGATYAGQPAGGIGAMLDSPRHDSEGFVHPIRVAPDGSIVVLGSGEIHDALSLERNTKHLANTIDDAAWLGGELYTLRTIAGLVEVQQWAPSTEMVKANSFAGVLAKALVADADRLIAVSLDAAGVPIFTKLDADLNIDDSPAPNDPAAAVELQNTVTSLSEDADTSLSMLLATIQVVDDGQGVNEITLSGPDAAMFEVVNSTLRLKAGAHLDFETQPTLSVIIDIDDATVGSSPDVSTEYTLSIDDANEAPTGLSLTNLASAIQADMDTSNGIKIADIVVADDALGTNVFTVGGPDAASFEMSGNSLFLKPGTSLDFEAKSVYNITISVDDASIGQTPDASIVFVLALVSVWHNMQIPTDVDSDGVVVPRDALLVIDDLNIHGSRSLHGEAHTNSLRLDTNNDYAISPADAVRVIDQLNAPTGASLNPTPPASTPSPNSLQPGNDQYASLALAVAIDQAMLQGIDEDTFLPKNSRRSR